MKSKTQKPSMVSYVSKFIALSTIILAVFVSQMYANEYVVFKDATLESMVASELDIYSPVPIEEMANLELLRVFPFYEISHLDGLEHAVNLKHLRIYNSLVGDISPIVNLPKLEHLYLNGHAIDNINEISNISSLRELTLGSANISDISFVQNFNQMTELELYDSFISDITPLLTHEDSLTTLNLSMNPINDISIFGTFTKLEYLYLSDILTSDFSALSNLTNIKDFYAQNNGISDISFIQNMDSLQILHLEGNKINDISPLDEIISYNSNLRHIDLRGNPLNQEAYDIYIPMYQKKGVYIEYDPVPEPASLLLMVIGAVAVNRKNR